MASPPAAEAARTLACLVQVQGPVRILCLQYRRTRMSEKGAFTLRSELLLHLIAFRGTYYNDLLHAGTRCLKLRSQSVQGVVSFWSILVWFSLV